MISRWKPYWLLSMAGTRLSGWLRFSNPLPTRAKRGTVALPLEGCVSPIWRIASATILAWNQCFISCPDKTALTKHIELPRYDSTAPFNLLRSGSTAALSTSCTVFDRFQSLSLIPHSLDTGLCKLLELSVVVRSRFVVAWSPCKLGCLRLSRQP